MQIDGAVIKEQGVTFAIVVVKQSAMHSNPLTFSRLFPGMPVVLMSQDSHGIPTYRGRPDIVNFLANIDPSRIPWKRYTVS